MSGAERGSGFASERSHRREGCGEGTAASERFPPRWGRRGASPAQNNPVPRDRVAHVPSPPAPWCRRRVELSQLSISPNGRRARGAVAAATERACHPVRKGAVQACGAGLLPPRAGGTPAPQQRTVPRPQPSSSLFVVRASGLHSGPPGRDFPPPRAGGTPAPQQSSRRSQGNGVGHSPTRLPAITAHTSSRCCVGAPAIVVSERTSPTPGSIHISLTERMVPDGSVIARS